MKKDIRVFNDPVMTEETKALAVDSLFYIDSFLRGAGYDRRKHTWTGSQGERRKLEKLVELGIVDVGMNHSQDTGGMYYISDGKRETIREWLQEERDKRWPRRYPK